MYKHDFVATSLRHSHKWKLEEWLYVQCPHCRKKQRFIVIDDSPPKELAFSCQHCYRDFAIGDIN